MAMAKPFTRTQALQNRAFLQQLSQGGNIRLAARAVGIAPGTLHGRRKACAAFAQRWDAALAIAHARLARRGGTQAPDPSRQAEGGGAARPAARLRTEGGEPVVVRRRDGKLQLRRAQPGKLTKACEQTFLAALSATANVRLSAAAAGAAERAFYRRRATNAGFAREWRFALQMGYDRLEMALLESASPISHEDDAWRHNDPPPIPSMTANQALQLLYLHQKEARLIGEQQHIKRRRGESREAHNIRLGAIYEERQRRAREAFLIAEHARRARGEPWLFGPEELPPLPALDQVTGWSNADPAKVPTDEGRALFGGWRLRDLEE
jgi:hypothetical protein